MRYGTSSSDVGAKGRLPTWNLAVAVAVAAAVAVVAAAAAVVVVVAVVAFDVVVVVFDVVAVVVAVFVVAVVVVPPIPSGAGPRDHETHPIWRRPWARSPGSSIAPHRLFHIDCTT